MIADEEDVRSTVMRLVDGLDRYRIPLGLVALVVFLRPVVSHSLMLGYGAIASTMLIWMLFVAAFNLLFGYTGLLSFGHAMFLGFGMYAAAIGVASFELPFVVAAGVGVVASGTFGYLLGHLIVQKGEIYFAMLTLAVSKAIHFIVNQDPYGLTGGSSGVTAGTVPGWIETYRGQNIVRLGGAEFDWYWLAGALFLVFMLALWQVLRSPFGRTLVAIRENERLARAMGVDVRRYKIASLTLSAGLAAVAGAMLSIDQHGASLETLSVPNSGNAVLMAVLGGVNYFLGPVAGVFTWMFTEDYLTDFRTLHLPLAEAPVVSVPLEGVLGYWNFFLGLTFVVVVLLSPKDGVWGYVRDAVAALARRLRGVLP